MVIIMVTVSKEYVNDEVDALIAKGLKSNNKHLIEKCMDEDKEVAQASYAMYQHVDSVERDEIYKSAEMEMADIRKELALELGRIVKVAGETPAQHEARFWTRPRGQLLWQRYSQAERIINEE